MSPRFQIDIIIEDKKWQEAIPSVSNLCRKACNAALDKRIKSDKEIAILLADDKKLQELNHDFRGKNKPTNVLSFPSEDENMLGDIAISIDTLKREAKEQGKSLKDHFSHLVVHATLHLLGFDHENDKDAKKMEALEISILKGLGIENPYKVNV